MKILEACVDSYQQAIKAAEYGADRLELCSNLDLDGLTPSEELCKKVLAGVQIPIMAMVRPRPGDFVYSHSEFKVMESQVDLFKKLGCTGVVFGLLTSAGKVDVLRTRLLVQRAKPMQVTFHKAFDQTPDLFQALEDLKLTGVDKILTSGGMPKAMEAIEMLNQLIEISGDNPTIIVAGKVSHQNIETLKKLIPYAKEFHGKKIVCDF